MGKIVTTHDLAQVLKLCDKYLINRYKTNIEQLMEMNIDNKVESILMLLLANEEISNLFEQYVLYDVMYDLLDSYSQKKIFAISDDTLRLSTKRPNDLTETEYRVTEDRLDKIFESLKSS